MLLGRFMNDAIKRHFGIRLMLRMLVGAAAISRDEATQFETWFIDGLTEAYGQQESTGGDPAANFLQYLREALLNGRAYISDRDGQAPEFARGALGWRLRGTFEGHENWEQQARTRIGVIENERLYLFPTTSFDVASEAASRAGETLSETTTSVGSSLVAHGWTERDGGKSTSRRRIGGVQQRVWDLPIDVLLGDEPDQPSNGDENEPAPTPTATRSTRRRRPIQYPRKQSPDTSGAARARSANAPPPKDRTAQPAATPPARRQPPLQLNTSQATAGTASETPTRTRVPCSSRGPRHTRTLAPRRHLRRCASSRTLRDHRQTRPRSQSRRTQRFMEIRNPDDLHHR